MAVENRVGSNLQIWWHRRLAGDVNTCARVAIDEAVIATLDVVPYDLPLRKRKPAMSTAILERDRRAVFLAEENDRLVSMMYPTGSRPICSLQPATYQESRTNMNAPVIFGSTLSEIANAYNSI